MESLTAVSETTMVVKSIQPICEEGAVDIGPFSANENGQQPEKDRQRKKDGKVGTEREAKYWSGLE